MKTLKGCISEGDSYEEVINNIKEAIDGWLESQNKITLIDNNSKIVEVSI